MNHSYFDKMKNGTITSILIISILLSVSEFSYCQSHIISGTVYNGITGKPISGMKVEIDNVKTTAQTNKKGQYTLQVPDTMKNLTFVDFPKMEIMELKTVHENEINIYLINANLNEISIEDLLKVKVVTAGKQEQQISDIPASVVVITREEIMRYGYSTLDELLAHILGVYVQDSYHPMGKISIGMRGYTTSGGGNDNIVILVNGVNQVEGVYNQYLLPKIALAVELIDRIEVIKGPMSVIYGSGAFYGAINIITNDPQKNATNIIQESYGSENTNKIVLKVVKSGTDYSLVFNASTYSTDGIDKPYSDMMTVPSDITQYGLPLNATTAGMFKDKRTYFNLSGNFSDFKIDIGFTEYEKGALLNAPSINYSSIIMNSPNVMILYEKYLSDKIKINAKLSYLGQSSLASYSIMQANSYITFGYNSQAYEIELNAFINPIPDLNITTGLFQRNLFYATNPFEGEAAWGPTAARSITKLSDNSNMINNAFFVQTDYAFNQYIKIVAGARLEQMMPFQYEASFGAPTVSAGRQIFKDKYNDNTIHFIPRIAVLFAPADGQVIKLLYGEAFKQPPLGELSDNLAYSGEYNFPKLNPERISTFELNYLMTIEQKFVTNLSVFRNELQDLISRTNFILNDGGIGAYTSNEGHIITYGAELEFKLRPNNNLELDISASYQKSENKQAGFTDMPLSQSPELLGYLNAAYIFSHNISIAFIGNYVSAQYADYDIDKNFYGQKVDGYFSIGGNLRFTDVFIKGLYAAFSCKNMLDQEIHYPVVSSSAFADKGILAPGRTFSVLLGYKF